MLEVREVRTSGEKKQFLKLPWKVYRDDPCWVPPLLFEVKAALDPKKHPFFEFGDAAFFMVFRDGQPVGRVSAHHNRNYNSYYKVNEGFFGFYECLDDAEASLALLNRAEAWLREKGATRVIGPMSYTVYDEIGFLADGWENEPRLPVMMEVYTPPYYLAQMAAAGYGKEIDWYAFLVGKSEIPMKDVFYKIKDRLIRQGFVFRTINMKRFDDEVESIKQLANTAWDANWGHVPYTERQLDHLAKALKLLVDPRLVFMVEKDGKVVGASVTLPDINPSVKKMNGRLFPFGWWHFLRAKKNATGLRTFLLGVAAEFRMKGIDAAMITDTIKVAHGIGFQWSDCSLIVETNRAMIDPILKWGGEVYRTYRIFSKHL